MSKTPDEALAFCAHILHGRGLIHFQTVLGMAGVPEMSDFVARSEDCLDRAEEFLSEVRECISCLSALTTEGRRKLLEAQEKARVVEEEYLRREREKAEREERESLPGLSPERPRADTVRDVSGMPVELGTISAPPKRGPGRPKKAPAEQIRPGFVPHAPPVADSAAPAMRQPDAWPVRQPLSDINQRRAVATAPAEQIRPGFVPQPAEDDLEWEDTPAPVATVPAPAPIQRTGRRI